MEEQVTDFDSAACTKFKFKFEANGMDIRITMERWN